MQDVHARRALQTRGKGSIVAWTCAAAFAATAWAAPVNAGAFLNLSFIPGESTNEQHKNEIDILSYDLSIVTPPTTGAARTRATPSCPPVTLVKNLDTASLIIAKKLAQGVHIAQGVLTFQRPGDARDYFILKMQEVVVNDFSQTTSADPGRLVERVVLTARRYDFEYRPQSPTGAPGDPIKFGWDCVTTEIT